MNRGAANPPAPSFRNTSTPPELISWGGDGVGPAVVVHVHQADHRHLAGGSAKGFGPVNVTVLHDASWILVSWLLVLLADTGSCCSEAMVVVVVKVQTLLVTVMVAVAVALTPRVPKLQVTAPGPIEQMPCGPRGVSGRQPAPGRLMVITTPVAGCGPRFSAVSW